MAPSVHTKTDMCVSRSSTKPFVSMQQSRSMAVTHALLVEYRQAKVTFVFMSHQRVRHLAHNLQHAHSCHENYEIQALANFLFEQDTTIYETQENNSVKGGHNGRMSTSFAQNLVGRKF